MAHLWMLDPDKVWVATTLLGDHHLVDDGTQAVLLRRLEDTINTWAILTSDLASVRVNGVPLSVGIAVLADRDEIRTSDGIVWFSTETRPSVEPLPDSAARGSCPRCKQPLTTGSAAVRCPLCAVWHHENGELNCWSYAPTCAVCNQQPTALDAPFRWSPEDL